MSHPRNLTDRKSLDRLAAHPHVTEVRHEGNDGYFLDLEQGFIFEEDEIGSLRAETVSDLLRQWRNVTIVKDQGDSQ